MYICLKFLLSKITYPKHIKLHEKYTLFYQYGVFDSLTVYTDMAKKMWKGCEDFLRFWLFLAPKDSQDLEDLTQTMLKHNHNWIYSPILHSLNSMKQVSVTVRKTQLFRKYISLLHVYLGLTNRKT